MSFDSDNICTREITREEVMKIAKTSKFDFHKDALDEMVASLNGIMPYIGKLNEVDTRGVAPFAHTYQTVSSDKNDHNTEHHKSSKTLLGVEAMLSNAPKSQDGYYQVPKVIES